MKEYYNTSCLISDALKAEERNRDTGRQRQGQTGRKGLLLSITLILLVKVLKFISPKEEHKMW